MGGRGASGGGGGGSGGKMTVGGATNSSNYPALSGSEKQVSWANSIRDKYFSHMASHFASRVNRADPGKNWSAEKLQTQLSAFKDTYSSSQWSQASTWISARNTLLPYG